MHMQQSDETFSYEDAFDAMMGGWKTRALSASNQRGDATAAAQNHDSKRVYASVYLSMPHSILLQTLSSLVSTSLSPKLPKEIESLAGRGTPLLLTLDNNQHCLFPSTGMAAIDSDTWHANEDTRRFAKLATWGSMSQARCILSIPTGALVPAVSEVQRRQAASTATQQPPDVAEMASLAKRSRQDVFGCAFGSAEDRARKLEAAAAAVQRRIPRPRVERSTLESLLETGIPGRLRPLKEFGFSKEDIPFFLRDRAIFCIHTDMSSAISEGNTMLHATRRDPAFENICGSVLVYRYGIPEQQGECGAQESSRADSKKRQGSANADGTNNPLLQLRRRKGRPARMRPTADSLVLYTIHGNLYVKSNFSGLSIKFQVCFCLDCISNKNLTCAYVCRACEMCARSSK